MSWSLQHYVGGVWSTPAVSINNPWETEPVDTTTDEIIKLATGAEGRLTRAKSSLLTLRISWDMKKNLFRTTLLAYLTNGYICKFTDLNLNAYVGKINKLTVGYKVVDGVVGNSVSVEFRQMDDPTI